MPKRRRQPSAEPARTGSNEPAVDAEPGADAEPAVGAEPSADAEPAVGARAASGTRTMIGGAEVPPLEPGAVVVHEGLAVIEVADPADLEMLLADSRLARMVLARIGERAAVALPHVAPSLLLALAKAGYIATVEGDS